MRIERESFYGERRVFEALGERVRQVETGGEAIEFPVAVISNSSLAERRRRRSLTGRAMGE